MGLFRRRIPKPEGRRGLKPLDARTMYHLRTQVTDLSQPRHVLQYSYFPTRQAAEKAARAADAGGWFTTVGEPLKEFSHDWRMRAERPDVVLSDDVVRDSTDFFEGLAARHGGEYDGWEAAAD